MIYTIYKRAPDILNINNIWTQFGHKDFISLAIYGVNDRKMMLTNERQWLIKTPAF